MQRSGNGVRHAPVALEAGDRRRGYLTRPASGARAADDGMRLAARARESAAANNRDRSSACV